MSINNISLAFWSGLSGIVFGVGLRTFSNTANYNFGFLTFMVVMLFLLSVYFFTKKKHLLFWPVLLGTIIGGVFGFWRSDSIIKTTQAEEFSNFYSESVQLVGFVEKEPDERISNTKLTLDIKEICLEDFCLEEPKQKVLVSIAPGSDIRYGDLVWVNGKLREPENFVGDAGKEFDYINYLAKDRITALISYPELEIIDRGYGNKVISSLINLKKKLLKGLGHVMPEPNGALGAGIVFGAKQALGPELSDQFRRTGLMHIVVLSGYNVTIVADSMVRILAFLGRGLSFGFGAIGIVAFAFLVGAGPTVVRASIMALLVLLARYTGRQSNVSRSLLLAGVIMLIHNPLILLYDISFQLSFLATLGLIYIFPFLERKLIWMTNKFQLREHASATLSAQMAVLPLLIFVMGEVSVIAPLANILVLPIIPLGMLLTFLTSLLGTFSLPLAKMLMLPTAGLLEYVLWITEQLSKLPFAVFQF